MEIDSTLRNLLAEKKMTLQQLADASDVPIETIRNIYYGKVDDPKIQTLLKISKALDVSVNYLCGEVKYTNEEQQLLKLYRNSSDHGKAVIRLFAQAESDMSDYERESDKHFISCLIPIGHVHDGVKYHSCNSVIIETDSYDAFIAFEITTDYFSPVYCSGDRLLLNNRFPYEGEHAVFLIDGYTYLRQYHKHDNGYTLQCLNGLGKDMTFERLDSVQCIGTVIGIIRA